MPSTYTVNLGIEKPATGEQSGTWGDTTNINFDILDQAINGAISITLASAGTSGSPNTLAISDGATSDGRNKWIEFVDGGDLGASAYVQLTPNDAEKIVFIRNSLSGSRSVILFQGTYDAARDLEVPAGVDMVVKFSGGGATATVTDVFTRLRVTAIETPSLTATTADINGGTIDGATVGASSASTGAFTTLTASTSLNIAASTTVDGVLDEDNMASNSATKLATQQSIKAYVDSQVGTVDTLAEILANGNTSGANNLIINSGQALTANTINETTAGSGVTIDSVLLKDDGVNATNLEITNIKANDGTAAATIANSTGNFTITNFISNSVDIGGGAIDGTVIGGSTAAAGTFTTGQFNTSLNVDGAVTADGLTVDGASNLQSINVAGSVSARIEFGLDGVNTPFTGQSASYIFSGQGGVGDYLAGSLNFQSRSSLDRPIQFITGATPARRLVIDGNGDVSFYEPTGTNARIFYDASTQFVVNEDGADFDFRVESDTNTHALFVDAEHSIVGVNTSITDVQDGGGGLTVNSNTTADEGAIAIVGGLFKSPSAGQAVGGLTWHLGGNSVERNVPVGGIYGYDDYTGGSYFGSLRLYALNSTLRLGLSVQASDVVVNDDSLNRDFRVESNYDTHALFVQASNGRVGIGASSPSEQLSVFKWGASNAIQIANHNTSAGSYNEASIKFQLSSTASSTLNWDINAEQTALTVDYEGSEKFRINSSGLLTNQIGAVFNESSADSDFRVESDTNTHALFVDAGNSRVGINNSSPTEALDVTGNVTISGSLSKGSGSFKIDHPVKPDTHHLVHSFVEAPQADNIYRGKVELLDGVATVNIDTVAGMTEGTFALLNREVQCFTSNESGWTAVRGKVDGNILTIEAQDPACTDTISWMVVGERQDQHMYDTDWTDENGKVIVEPLKETEGA